MNGLAQSLGIAASTHELAALLVALLITAATMAFAWLIGRWSGPLITGAWERKVGTRAEAMTPRLCSLVRYLLTWIFLAIALRIERWPSAASFLLGLVAAAAAAMFVRNIIRGLGLSRALAWLLAAFLFVAILTDAVGGLSKITGPLDEVALAIGGRHFSLLDLVQGLFALLALYAVVRLVIRLVGHAIRGTHGLDPTQQLLTQKLAAIAIIAIAFFVGIDLAGIDLTALAVFSGALGLAVGFGLQKTFGNLIAGIILLMDRSIKPGDVIEVGESFGSVSKIGVRAVSIVTRDGKKYLIPNELLMTEEVVNWSYSSREVRISIPVGVAYDCDVELAQKLMIEAAISAQRVLKVPKPNVWMTAFGESSIEHEIRVWIDDPEAGIGSIRSEILNRLLQLFTQNGIELPNPQRDLTIRSWPAEGGPVIPGRAEPSTP